MINGEVVIDAVVHAFDARQTNATSRYGEILLETMYNGQARMAPAGYALSRNRFFQRMTAEALESALFRESSTDVACYHPIPAWGILRDLSPASVGLEIRRRNPNRMFVFGAVSPLEGRKAIDDLERQVEEWDIVGVKLYPVDIIDGILRTLRLNDPKVMYPLLEKCRELGVSTIAIHKSVPIGPAPLSAFRPDDVDEAAADFPDLTFEIVHGGFAFLEETAFQVARFENIYVNLETTAAMIVKRPRAFARILGELLFWGGARKILWGTGAIPHPAPLLDAFRDFQIPEDLREGYGYPEITEQDRADILGRNFARVHGIALDELRARIEGDALMRSDDTSPWMLLPTPDQPDPLALEDRSYAGT
jgi:predicted TIM-barrel fold metal-dependent hydrolase